MDHSLDQIIADGDVERLVLIWKKSQTSSWGENERKLINANLNQIAKLNGIGEVKSFRELVEAVDRKSINNLIDAKNYDELSKKGSKSTYWADLISDVLEQRIKSEGYGFIKPKDLAKLLHDIIPLITSEENIVRDLLQNENKKHKTYVKNFAVEYAKVLDPDSNDIDVASLILTPSSMHSAPRKIGEIFLMNLSDEMVQRLLKSRKRDLRSLIKELRPDLYYDFVEEASEEGREENY